MGLAGFHPLVSRWFSETLGTPTSAQLRGWAAIREGRHTLIAAPTGSGKTFAAFLAAIDALVREGVAGRLEDVTRVAQKYFVPEGRLVMRIMPRGGVEK